MDELKAGPELDAKIATIVGFVPGPHDWDNTGDSNHYGSIYRCTRCDEVKLDDTDADDKFGTSKCLPAYSTDERFAFKAAEKAGLFKFGTAVKDGWLTLAGVGDGDQNPAKQWGFMQFGYGIQACWWMWPGANGDLVGIAAGTPAEAICRAIVHLAKGPN